MKLMLQSQDVFLQLYVSELSCRAQAGQQASQWQEEDSRQRPNSCPALANDWLFDLLGLSERAAIQLQEPVQDIVAIGDIGTQASKHVALSQYSLLFGHAQGSIHLFLERNADQMPSVACYTHSCQDVQ